jgi:hypothetical protein
VTTPRSEQPLTPGEGVVLVVVLTLLFSWGLLPLAAEFLGAYR